jgi:hypothetical protein
MYRKHPDPIQTDMFMHTDCLYCAGIEPVTSCVIDQYSVHCAKSVLTSDLFIYKNSDIGRLFKQDVIQKRKVRNITSKSM